ncbi:MAG TPA: hypothetical protein VMW10_01630 [Alphaproteobacteria bacterium]|nr:hypothetical protein [Alphaproteobacteria bacterium]
MKIIERGNLTLGLILKNEAENILKTSIRWWDRSLSTFKKRHPRPFLPEIGQAVMVGNGLVLTKVKHGNGKGAIPNRFALVGHKRTLEAVKELL